MMAFSFMLFALGVFLWTFLEYAIHGFLSHVFNTFATAFHAGHHRNPRMVFTAGAWMPTAIVSALIFGIFGWTPATTVWLGVVAGFIGYEMIHYRYHFARPICALEDRMRTRHLAHHMRAPKQIFGVTNSLWDRAFGSEPAEARLTELRASVAATAPLTGPSNLRLVIRPWVYLR
jgi:sterol desaturase/sphingolipid hydroxylase (fatty acid hydroxylase superfamily)